MAKMKQNAKPLYDKWADIYEKELARLQKENPNCETGWCIIENENFVKTLEDVVGLYIFGDDDNALGMIDEMIGEYGEDDILFGFKLIDIMHEMEKYLEW